MSSTSLALSSNCSSPDLVTSPSDSLFVSFTFSRLFMLLGYLILAGCTQIKIMVEFLFLNQEDEGGVPRKHISKPRLYLLYQSCAEVGKMLALKKIF